MAVAEALTNLALAPISCLEVNCLHNIFNTFKYIIYT